MNIDINAKQLINIIEKAGYEAYIVGGCVRDYIMSKPCDDVDITTSAKPLELEKVLDDNDVRYIETGIKHGTITAIIDSASYEITTYRTDGDYKDSRHPENVQFVTSIDEDLARRDFTINAMAYNDSTGLVDLYGGRADIDNKIIRAVGDPDKRFKEDALRIMRAIRFSSVLGFDIEPATKKAIFDNMQLLLNVSAERIFTELSKLLMGDNVFDVLMEYRDVIATIIPEIKSTFDFPQHTKWHLYDVWAHTCKAVESAPKDLAIKLTMLLHDIGKPAVKVTDDRGTDHFRGHQIVSAEMAAPVLKRLKVSNELYDRVMAIIPIHDVHIGTSRRFVKRWLNRLGEASLLDLVAVKRSDKMAQNLELTMPEIDNLKLTEAEIHSIIEEGEPFTVKELDINGNDLMALGFEGKEIGNALNQILELVIDNELKNNRADIIRFLDNGNFYNID